MWVSLSAEDGHPGRVAARNALSMQMTQAQIDQAQQLIAQSRVPRNSR
jgi:hypothetical protein